MVKLVEPGWTLCDRLLQERRDLVAVLLARLSLLVQLVQHGDDPHLQVDRNDSNPRKVINFVWAKLGFGWLQCVCCSIHWFRPVTEESSSSGGIFSYVNKALKTSSQYLPAPMTGVFNPDRAFANARLSSTDIRNISSLAYIPAWEQLLIVISRASAPCKSLHLCLTCASFFRGACSGDYGNTKALVEPLY